MWSYYSVLDGWSECLSDLHLPHQTNQDINTSILKTVQTLPCLIKILDRIWILMFYLLIHGVRTLLSGLAGKWSCCRNKRRKENENIQKSLFQVGGYLSRCIPLVIEHFWEVEHKLRQRIFCIISHNSQ